MVFSAPEMTTVSKPNKNPASAEGSDRGTKSSTAVKDHFFVELRHARLDIAFDHAFAEMDGTGQVILGEFAFLAHVDEHEFLAAIQARLYFIHVRFADPRARVVHN